MKRQANMYLIIIVLAIILNGCTYSNQQVSNQEQSKDLDNNIERLIEDNRAELKIKQKNGKFYRAKSQFKDRIREELRDYRVEKSNEGFDFQYDIIFKFTGYENISINIEKGYFWFENSNKVYKLKGWNKEFWDRYILKEIDDEVLYHSFERDIIEQYPYMDLDSDDEFDDVILYYDGDIRLKIKDHDVCVLSDVEEGAIESKRLSHNMDSKLYIKENKNNDEHLFIVGSTYSYVNRIGSLSWVKVYLYKENCLEKIWDSEDILSSDIIVKDVKEDELTFLIENIDLTMDIKLTSDERENLKEYLDFLKENNEKLIGKDDFEFFSGMPQYTFYDYDEDGKDELITEVYMRGGAPGITRRILFIYKINNEGLELFKVLFNNRTEGMMETLNNEKF